MLVRHGRAFTCPSTRSTRAASWRKTAVNLPPSPRADLVFRRPESEPRRACAQDLMRVQLNGPKASAPLAALADGSIVSLSHSSGVVLPWTVTRRKLGTL